jgi:subtilisin family serine protease
LKVVAPGVSVISTFIDVREVDGINNSSGTIEAYRVHGFDTSNQELTCSAAPTVSGALVACGVGNTSDFKSSLVGNIALIQRGGTSTATGTTLTFAEKSKNAKRNGAVGVIIYNNRATENASEAPGWGMTGLRGSSDVPPVVVGVTQVEGQQLISIAGAATTMGFARHNSIEGWRLESGTSMATPHAAAVAALVWAAAPTASASDVANAVINTAKDLGAPGVDNVYGHGLVNALDAAKQLNPGAFGAGGTPPSAPRTGRTPGRRGP